VVSKTWPKRKGSVRQSTDVRYLDRGYPIAIVGLTDHTGLTPVYTNSSRPAIQETPPNVLIYNSDESRLELSCPASGIWIPITGSGTSSSGVIVGSGNNIALGDPTDGSYLDGLLPLSGTMTIADAVDEINEVLVTLSGVVPATAVTHDTLRYDGADWVANSQVVSDGPNFSIAGGLTVSGFTVLSSGVSPATSGTVGGTSGEIRWNDNFLFLKTSLGWARVALGYF